jgi:hypothetical protein
LITYADVELAAEAERIGPRGASGRPLVDASGLEKSALEAYWK